MQVETFIKTEQEQKTEWQKFEQYVQEEAIEKKRVLCKKLHLDRQLEMLDEIEQLAKFPYKMMTEEEHTVYYGLFPTYYKENSGNGSRGYLKHYAFDVIPTSVLETWSDCMNKKLFNYYEIRTPEVLKVDPLLIGHVDGVTRPFLIARWGEALKPFAELKKMWEERPKLSTGMSSWIEVPSPFSQERLREMKAALQPSSATWTLSSQLLGGGTLGGFGS